EGAAIEPRYLDDQPALWLQHAPGGFQAAQRIVIVLEEVPHRDEIEPLVVEWRVVEQPAVKLDVTEGGGKCQILEVHPCDMRPVPGMQALKKRSDGASDIEYLTVAAELDIARDDAVRVGMKHVHRVSD